MLNATLAWNALAHTGKNGRVACVPIADVGAQYGSSESDIPHRLAGCADQVPF
jgi:hypothetical protein